MIKHLLRTRQVEGRLETNRSAVDTLKLKLFKTIEALLSGGSESDCPDNVPRLCFQKLHAGHLLGSIVEIRRTRYSGPDCVILVARFKAIKEPINEWMYCLPKGKYIWFFNRCFSLPSRKFQIFRKS